MQKKTNASSKKSRRDVGVSEIEFLNLILGALVIITQANLANLVTARRQLETWRAVCRLPQVLRGRGAKRGELRGAVWAGQGRSRSVVWEPAHGR